MTRQLALIAVTMGLLATGVGCVSCRYQGYQESLKPAEPLPCPPTARAHVYLFMMNGADVFEMAGMLTLRDKLCQAGFAKVYYGQLFHADWFAREICRLHAQEPEARFVLLGYGPAAKTITTVAREAGRDGRPIESLVLLDPVGLNEDLTQTLTAPSMVIRSHGWSGSSQLVSTEQVNATGVGHVNLPTNAGTVRVIADVLAVAAEAVPVAGENWLPRLPLSEKASPCPRPVAAVPATPVGSGWSFLTDTGPFPVPNPE